MTMTVPTHATHLVLDREGFTLAWATSEALALAIAERHGGAYVATNVEEATAFEDALERAGLLVPQQVTQLVAPEAPAKFTIGFTAGGHLAQRTRREMRRAGIAVPRTTSPSIVADLVAEAGFAPVIVPAREL